MSPRFPRLACTTSAHTHAPTPLLAAAAFLGHDVGVGAVLWSYGRSEAPDRSRLFQLTGAMAIFELTWEITKTSLQRKDRHKGLPNSLHIITAFEALPEKEHDRLKI